MAGPAERVPSVCPRSLCWSFGKVLQHFTAYRDGTHGEHPQESLCKTSRKNVENQRKIGSGGSPERPRGLPKRSQNASRKACRKSSKKNGPPGGTISVKIPILSDFGDPAGARKSTKTRPVEVPNGKITFFHQFLRGSCCGSVF